MDTTCYYTFSTIAQTLAGAFGFLVAVVLFQIQGLLSNINKGFHAVLDHWEFSQDELSAMNKGARLGKWAEIEGCLRAATKLKPEFELPIERKRLHLTIRSDLLENLVALRAVKSSLERSLHLTGATIALSVILLAFTPLFSSSTFLVVIALLAGVVGACSCLLTYYSLVRTVTRR